MSKEASKKRREAEARLIADLLAALPAFEMPRRSQHNSSSSSMNNATCSNNPQQPRKSSQGCYEDVISNGISNMALSISATLPTLRYAAVFARKQALLSQFFNMTMMTGGIIKHEQIDPDSPLSGDFCSSGSLIHRSELPGLIIVFDPTKRIYPISNGTPLEVAGEMVYVSENVMTYLGHSVQDILSRADSVYDLLLPEERSKIMDIVTRMVLNQEMEERSFLCRFSNALFTRRVRTMSSDYKLMLVKARLLMSSSPLIVFTCCPVLTPLYQRDIDFLVHEPGVFTFKCSPELIITRVDNRAGLFLAFEDEAELLGRRWLNLIHPDDLMSVVEQLRGVLGPNKRDDAATMFVVRMMKAGDEAAPTDCIYVSVVLAYRHFGGASLANNNNAPSSNANQQPSPTTPASGGGDKMVEDEAFSEACQPSVTITCQVLPDNNMEIVNEIKKYANPLFNCHGLSRSSNTATTPAGNNAAPARDAPNATNVSPNMNASPPNPNNAAGHYRRNNSHTPGTQSQNQQHARRQAHRMSYRSSITSYDGLFYDANVDSASVVTAPAIPAELARRLPTARRSSVVSAPGFAIPPGAGGRMHASTSDHTLYLAAQQQQQAQPFSKRQRTSDMIYPNDDQQSPMSAVSYGPVATSPGFANEAVGSLPVGGNQWSSYRQQQRWEQMSDCSASTPGYQPRSHAISVQAQPVNCYSFSTVSATTPVDSSPAPIFTTGLARGMRTSQSHMFSKNSAMSSSGSHYQRRLQHQQNNNNAQSLPQQQQQQQALYGTSPSSAHSLSFIDQQYGSTTNNATVLTGSMAKSNSFFFPHRPNDWGPVRRESQNFQSIAPDVLFGTHQQQHNAQQQPFLSNFGNSQAAAIPAAEDADFLYQAISAPSADFYGNAYNQPVAPFFSYVPSSSVNDEQDQWPSPGQVALGQAPTGFAPPAVSVTQQIHERIARKASVKKVTEWLGYNFDPSTNGTDAGATSMMPTGANEAMITNGAMLLPELQAEELSIFLDQQNATAGVIKQEPEPEPQWQEWPAMNFGAEANAGMMEEMPNGGIVDEDDSGFSVGGHYSADDSPVSAGHQRQKMLHHTVVLVVDHQRQLVNSGQGTATSNLNASTNNENDNSNNMVFAM